MKNSGRTLVALAISLTLSGCGEATSASNGKSTGGSSGVPGSGGSASGSGGNAGGSGGSASGGAGAGGVGENPPHETLEGLWVAFQRSDIGPCGGEPTWMGDGVAIRLTWDTAVVDHLETFNCTSDGTCNDAPSAYGTYYFRDGHWVATYEPFLQDGTCQRDLNVLALSSDGVLRITHNENRINMICGPIPDSAFTCSNEWLQEFRKRAE